MVPHVSPAPLTGQADEKKTGARVDGEQGHCAPATMADGVTPGEGT